jgi:hypothetical protein
VNQIGYVYKITNKLNGKAYVGQTTMKSIHDRITCHLASSSKMVIGKALKKYGIDGFTVEELAKAYSIEELNTLEEFYINHYNTLLTGYNRRPGGRNYKVTQDNIRSLQTSHKKQMRAVVQYDKNLNKIAEYFSMKEAARITGTFAVAIMNCCKNKPLNKTANGFVWAYKGNEPRFPAVKYGKVVIQLDKDHNTITEFPTASQAHRKTGISRSHIAECCNLVRKSAGGYIWKFKENQ